MTYEVRIRKKVARGLNRLPKRVQQLLFLLVADLQSNLFELLVNANLQLTGTGVADGEEWGS